MWYELTSVAARPLRDRECRSKHFLACFYVVSIAILPKFEIGYCLWVKLA